MSGISKIVIDQQLAQIGVEVTPAQMHITTPRPKMHITSESPKMTVDRKNPTFTIDKKRINSESGLKSPKEFTFEFRDRAKAAATNFTTRTVRDGDFFAQVSRGGNRIAQAARRNSLDTNLKKDLNIAPMPKSPAKVSWDPGYVRIDWSSHSLVIEWDKEYMPELTIDPPYSVEVFLRTKPYFRITIEEGQGLNTAGRQVDETL